MASSSLRLVLGDQLTAGIPLLTDADRSRDIVLMAEVTDETAYVPHHKKKIIFVLSAMRAFAAELRAAGWRVDYVKLDDPGNTGSLAGELRRAVARHKSQQVVTMEASEHRVLAMQRTWQADLGRPTAILSDPRLLCSKEEFAAWANARKSIRMEYFYRGMRRKTDLLMDGEEPAGGQWNFDADNRKGPPGALMMPTPFRVEPGLETLAVIAMVKKRFAKNFGDAEPFWFPVTRQDAEAAAKKFMREGLPQFGDYQDAMVSGQKFLFHSILSPLINVGLLDPLTLCRMAEAEWRAGRAPLNAVEGFIRQIIGWREYVRGIYWWQGPSYLRSNALNATRALPSMYWTGQSQMACIAAAIGQTKSDAYTHHIQRLMVTGNFALLAGIDPHELHEWYLAVYADAFEWVEAPNTIGMSQFADGGLLASKPYAASGAYIDRMSDYCSGCRYKVAEKSGPQSCPLNPLYWDFLIRHRARFQGNPRMAQMYRVYDKIKPEVRAAMSERARDFLKQIDDHGTDDA
jgi:deoxyribodipyrimidine photolyase-related protein